MGVFEPSVRLRVESSPLASVSFCSFIGLSYVVLLYVRTDPSLGRDHPKTIKKRFARVCVCCVISVLLFRLCCCVPDEQGEPVWRLLSFKLQGLVASVILPLLLCVTLFLGPLIQNYYNNLFKVFLSQCYWRYSFTNLIWIRTIIVGPWTEEIVYRACMVPVLAAGFGDTLSVFLNPLFFGLAHFHHTTSSIKGGVPVGKALLISSFQFSYTTIFGIFSAFLLVRTGNIVSSITCHMFCNFIGFPDINDLIHNHPPFQTRIIIIAYVIGLFFFSILLTPLTSHFLYQYI